MPKYWVVERVTTVTERHYLITAPDKDAAGEVMTGVNIPRPRKVFQIREDIDWCTVQEQQVTP